MIFFKGRNGSITERKQIDKKIMNISSNKLNKRNSIYKRKSFLSKSKDYYQSRTINVNDDENLKLNLRQNSKIKNKENNPSLKINFKEIVNEYNQENINLINYTNRLNRNNRNNKEKYLSQFFIEKVINMDNCQNNDNNDRKYNTIRANSKQNKYSRNDINKLEYHKNSNQSYIKRNESSINLENELNYEFEIRFLKKRLKELQKANNKIKVKIFNIKTEQNRHKQKSKKEDIISKVIELYTQYIKNDQNFQSNEENVSGQSPVIKTFKNMLLNIMDWKFSYENKLMVEQFFSAINSYLNNNNKKRDFKNNIKEIKMLLKKRILIREAINEIKFTEGQNQNLKNYFLNLCKYLKFQNLEQLEQFLKNTFIKSNAEFREINRLKNLVLQNNRNKKKNISSNKGPKFSNDFFRDKKPLIRKQNSEINININSRNIEKIYNYSKDPSIEDDIFYTYREYRQNNKNENEYNNEKTKRSNFNKQNSCINFYKDADKENFNSNNLAKRKIDIPNYIKSVTKHYLRNESK